jgi:hypothetical protein
MNRSIRVVILALLGVGVAGYELRGADEQTWVGIVSDGACRDDHGGEVDPKECTMKCVNGGDKFVLMVDGYTKAMPIANQDFPDLKTRAGETVKATGELKDGAIVITRLEGR